VTAPQHSGLATKSRRHETNLLSFVSLCLRGGSFALLAATLGAQQPPDRSRPPQLGPAPALRLPDIQKKQLANGLPVWLVELHEVPVVQVNLVVFGGSANETGKQFGTASLTAAMLEQGAGSRSALEIADAIDYLGADLSASSGFDSTAVRLHVPVSHLSEALPIMADVALRPTFPKDELERQRQERLTSLLQARDDPATISAVTFARALYGPEHRYGVPTFGTAETIKAFTVDDLKTFYTSIFRSDNAALLVVGDVTGAGMLPLLESTFGAWKGATGPKPTQKLPAVNPPAARQIYLVDKPGAAQSQIRIGWIGVPRSTPDFFPLRVLNTVLGESFTSRLNNNLREQHGYTYGASSTFDMRASAGPFYAAAGVQTDKTSESLTEFFNELNGILKPVPAEELTRAKNYIALRYPGGFETTGDISRRLEDALVYQLPNDYFSTYVQKIQAITAADVQRVAQKYIAPGRFAVVVVGDQKVIEPKIQPLNLGPIKKLTVDDVFGQKP
jgi:zinc protease